jgi:hypothetical protein
MLPFSLVVVLIFSGLSYPDTHPQPRVAPAASGELRTGQRLTEYIAKQLLRGKMQRYCI